MTIQRVVLVRVGELPELAPTAPDQTPILSDFQAILDKLPKRHRVVLFNELSRIEVLMKLAWGAYPLLQFLGTCDLGEQTQAGDATRSAAECLYRNYPFLARGQTQAGLSAATTLAGISLAKPNAAKGGEPSSGSPPPAQSPCDRDTPDLFGPVGPEDVKKDADA